jgi:hypothetical protein
MARKMQLLEASAGKKPGREGLPKKNTILVDNSLQPLRMPNKQMQSTF